MKYNYSVKIYLSVKYFKLTLNLDLKRDKLTTDNGYWPPGTDHTTCPFRLTEGTGNGSLRDGLSSESSVEPLLEGLDSTTGESFCLLFLTRIVLNCCFDAEGPR
jgi:hypothetical protein